MPAISRRCTRLPRRCARAVGLGATDAEGFAWGALDALRADPDSWQGRQFLLWVRRPDRDRAGCDRDAVRDRRRRGHRVAHLRARAPGARRPRRGGRGPAGAGGVRARAAGPRRVLRARRRESVLHHLERYLFEPSPPRIDAGEVVGLLEAGGERAEAELIASEVLAALRDGVPASEIVVVCRSLRRSGLLLLRTLRRYGVPAAGAIRASVAHTALGRALLALTRCALSPAAPRRTCWRTCGRRGCSTRRRPVDALAAEVARRGLTTAPTPACWPGAAAGRDRRAAPGARSGGGARRPRTPAAGGAAAGRAAQLSAAEALDARAAAAVLGALSEAASCNR